VTGAVSFGLALAGSYLFEHGARRIRSAWSRLSGNGDLRLATAARRASPARRRASTCSSRQSCPPRRHTAHIALVRPTRTDRVRITPASNTQHLSGRRDACLIDMDFG
jgi:hypothetical protein